MEEESKLKREIIRISGLKKIYKMGNQQVNALNGADLVIRENEYVAIMGPSGSGKSTMMNILGCLDTPTEGCYILNGTDVSKMEDSQLAEVRNKEIGFVFQSFNLLPRYTALENTALPLIYAGFSKEEREERARKALETVGLGERTTHRPSELSGGQRQRVAIARALINNPSIILADEPTANLDNDTTKEIMELFMKINKQQGPTIIMVTHNKTLLKDYPGKTYLCERMSCTPMKDFSEIEIDFSDFL